MTALCGCTGQAPFDQIRADCAAMLAAQGAYGTAEPAIGTAENAAFGIRLHATLPEDRFDRQPLLIDGHLLVADIRLDNRDELIRLLGWAADPHSSSDSELLLRAWLRWGESCLERIVGDYAFAVYQIDNRRLTLVRDCLGNRPLFFASQAENVGFASMPSGLLALPRFRRGFNLRALALAAADIQTEDAETYFRSVSRVLPGQIVKITSGAVSSRLYWNPCIEELRLKSDADYIAGYRHVLGEAVRAQLRRTSGPIATHLSSGLDSGAVATTAALLKQPGDQIVAFTAAPRRGFDERPLRGRFADESELASLTARRHDIRHEVVRPAGSSLSLVRSLVATSQEPSCNIMNQDWFWSIEQLARGMGSKVLLTGEHGNATLNAGGLRVLPDWIRALRLSKWWDEARYAAAGEDVSWRGILFNSFEPWLPKRARRALYQRFLDVEPRRRSVFLTDSWIRELGRRIESGYLSGPCTAFAKTRLRMLRRSDNGLLLKGSLARHGIDNRSPLGDRRVIEFSLGLPPERMFAQGRPQPLARQALSDRVPGEVLISKSRGYQSADWFASLDPAEIRSMTEEIASSLTVRQLIDVPKIHRAIDQWPPDDLHRFGQYQRFSIDLPMAIATGFFILEAERWMAGGAPAGCDWPTGQVPRDVPA